MAGTAKDRKNSGRKVTKIYHPKIYPYEEVKYDNWDDYRDGFRRLGKDKTIITNMVKEQYRFRIDRNLALIEMNKKNKRLLRIRKAKKKTRPRVSK